MRVRESSFCTPRAKKKKKKKKKSVSLLLRVSDGSDVAPCKKKFLSSALFLSSSSLINIKWKNFSYQCDDTMMSFIYAFAVEFC